MDIVASIYSHEICSFLEQDVFGECAEVFVRPPVDSIEKVAISVYLNGFKKQLPIIFFRWLCLPI